MARFAVLTDDDYVAARDALVDDGLLARGRGRGGSIMRVVDADEDEEDGEDAGAMMPTTRKGSS